MTSIQNKVFVYYFGGQLDKYLRNNKLMKAHGKNGLLLLLLAQEFLHVKSFTRDDQGSHRAQKNIPRQSTNRGHRSLGSEERHHLTSLELGDVLLTIHSLLLLLLPKEY